jgi:DNA-binding MarR family transcriptional regulator
VERRADPDDGRRVLIGLIPEGVRRLEALSTAHVKELAAVAPTLLGALRVFNDADMTSALNPTRCCVISDLLILKKKVISLKGHFGASLDQIGRFAPRCESLRAAAIRKQKTRSNG